MRRLQQRRSIAKFLCFLMILEMFVASPNVAEASVSKTISKNGREYCAVEGNKQTITVTLASPNKPENTKVVSSSVPSWASVSKPNYNSPVFKVTVQQNNGSGSRVENIKFTDGTNTWTLTLTQYVYKAPTTTPAPKKVTKEPTKKVTQKATPVPTKAPTSTPTPAPAETLPISRNTMQFSAQGGQDTLSLQGTGYSLTFSYPDNPSAPSGWVSMIYDGSTIKVKVNKNTDYAPRSMKVTITDTNTKQYAYVTINQSAAPTPTPTPVPAETLPVKTKKLQFGAQGGQDTLTLDGKGYNLAFSYPDNPSVPTGWVTMSYENSKIIVKVKQNKNHAPRSMKVTITDKNTNQYAYVTINQSSAPTPTPAFLSVDREEFSCDSKGGDAFVTVKGAVGTLGYSFAWNPEDNNGWVRVKPEGNRLHFIIDENRTIKARTATILIKDSQTKKDVTVTIKQEGMPNTTAVSNDTLRAEQGTILFGCEGGTKSVRILGKSGTLRVDPTGKEGWYSATVDGNIVEIRANENASFARRAYLDVTDMGTGKTIRLEICQDAEPVRRSLEIDHRALTYSASKQTKTVKVSGQVGSLVISRRYNDIWYTVREEKGTIFIEVTENTGGRRTGFLDIVDTESGESVWVAIYQGNDLDPEPSPLPGDYEPSLSIDGYRCDFTWAKQIERIPLNSYELLNDYFYDWDREDAMNWARASFDGENLCISVEENEDKRCRSVVVSIYGPLRYLGQIKISQAGKTPTMVASSEEVPFGTNGGTQWVRISGASSFPIITKQTDATWLKVESGGIDEKGLYYSLTASQNYEGERQEEVHVFDRLTGQQIRIMVYQTAAPGKGNNSESESNEEETENDKSDFKSEYWVKYDANGGTNPPSSQIKWNSSNPDYHIVLTTDTPKRLGYDFVGWGLTSKDKYPAYHPGDKYDKNMDITLYAIWKSNGFWERFEVTHSIREPYNSAVAGAKSISMDQYWTLFQKRKSLYFPKDLDVGISNPWEEVTFTVDGVERTCFAREVRYMNTLYERLAIHRFVGRIGKKAIEVPDAAYFLRYYLCALGGKVKYGLDHYIYSGSFVVDCFNAEVNSIMKKMEGGLPKNQSIVFTDKNAGKNRISFTTNSYSEVESDSAWDANGFLGIKEGSYGLSGKCSYDGEVYTMEICFYLQDYYDFYYEDQDPNSQSRFNLAGVYGDELAFLVPWGMAKPFENTGVLHVKMTWRAGQKADLMKWRTKKWYGEDASLANMSVIPYK